jgi:hypothetical protein
MAPTARRSTDPEAAWRRERLARQRLAGAVESSPEALVSWFGAVQAQDYAGALWALGARLGGAEVASVEAAIGSRAIVRTWPMRGTLHFVPAADVRWMLKLLAPRALGGASARHRQLGLEEGDFTLAERLLARELAGGRRLTRPEAYAVLERGGVAPTGQRGIHVLGFLAHHGVLCLGPWQGRQPTFVLLDEWVPATAEPSREEALAILATRYFQSHGPAELQDFAWWSGLPLRDARAAVALAGASVAAERHGESTLYTGVAPLPATPPRRGPAAVLLPPWDEYLVAYRDRSLALHDPGGRSGVELIGKPLLLVEGRVCGAWRRAHAGGAVRLGLELWVALGPGEQRAVARAAAAYGRFVGKPVEVAAPWSSGATAP